MYSRPANESRDLNEMIGDVAGSCFVRAGTSCCPAIAETS